MIEDRPEIFIEENSPRDGIQNEPILFTLEERIELVNALSACGFQRIQIGSFVNPRRVPQMADTERLYERIRHQPDVTYSALVLNEKGLDRAFLCGIEHLSFFVSASETHSRKNNNCSVAEGLAQSKGLIERAKGRGLQVQAGVMNAFGCHFEGVVPPQRVIDMIRLFSEWGVDEVNLADTSGVANPKQMEEIIPRVKEVVDIPVSLHLHDTHGFSLANVYAAWKAGITRFDASCGGLGGCPFIPGAAGNVPTEDLVHFFQAMGVSTGISQEKLVGVVHDLESKLKRSLPGRFTRTHCGGGNSIRDSRQ